MYMVCYHPPATEDWAFLYRISFAPLRNFAWLTPPEWMTGWGAALVLKLLGNVIIPSICLGIVVYAISQIKKKGTLQWQYVWLHKEKLLIPAAHYLFSFVLVVAIVMCCMLLANPDYLRESYNVLFLHRYDAYALIKINQPVVIRSMILQCEASTFFNAITIFICLLGMWVTYAIVSWRKENESRNKQQN